MAKYSVTMQRTASLSLAVGTVNAPAASMRRIKIYDITFGSEATPADTALLWQLSRVTTAGTSTSVTPTPLDPADTASVATAGQNATVQPTGGTLFLLTVPLNQRASFRWVAAPGSELVVPATASNGIMTNTPVTNGGLPLVTSTQLIEEQ